MKQSDSLYAQLVSMASCILIIFFSLSRMIYMTELLQKLDALLGRGRYKLKVKPCAPAPKRWVKAAQEETQVVMD